MVGKRILAVSIFACTLLTGCGRGKESVQVSFEPYEREIYTTCIVKKGDLQTIERKVIPARTQEVIHYKKKDMELKDAQIFVSEGQRVKKGELLVEFTSQELEEQIEEYREQIKEKTLALEHMERQEKIAGGYAGEIEECKRQMVVARLYLKQALDKKRESRIYARKGGRIDKIYTVLRTGEFTGENVLIRQVCREARKEKVIEKAGKVLKNVVYLDRDAVRLGDEGNFVYQLDEERRRNVVWVTTGEKAGNDIVVTEGLSGGEIVVKGERR